MTVQPFDPTTQTFATNASNIMANNPALDHQLVATLAQQPGTPDQISTAANQMQTTLASGWNGWETAFNDPVLQQRPSAPIVLAQYIHDTIGALPLQAGDFTTIQTSLQKAGLADPSLPADGAWTPQWQQAWNNGMEAARADQIAGKRPGATKSSDWFHGFLHDISPTGIGDAVVGFAKDLRTAVGHLEGGLTTGYSQIFGGEGGSIKHQFGQNAADQINVLGGHTTPAEQERQLNVLSALHDALTVASLVPLVKAGTLSIRVVGSQFARGTLAAGDAAVTRTPGIIAKTLFGARTVTADQLRALPAEVGGYGTPIAGARGLGNSALEDLVSPRWYDNYPGLARLVPMVAKSADSDGWYYNLRNFMAQPYRLAPVRAAGTAYGQAQALSLGLHGLAAISPNSAIDKEHVFDAVNTNIDNWERRNIGFAPLDLNTPQMFLHGELNGATTSRFIGQQVDDATNKFVDFLGTKGVPAAFQQALATGRTPMSRTDMLKITGGDSAALNEFMTDHVAEAARDFYVERNLGHAVTLATPEEKDQVGQLSDQFWALDNTGKQKVVADMLDGDPHVQYLTNRLKGTLLRNTNDPKAALANAYTQFHESKQAFQRMHQLGDPQFFLTPQGQADLAEHPWATDPNAPVSARVQNLTPNKPGMYGLAKNASLTRAQAMRDADRFEQQLGAAKNVGESDQTIAHMKTYLWNHHGQDARSQDIFASTPTKMVDLLRARAQDLASDVTLTPDAPDAVHERMQALNDAGYKVVAGSHIGHRYDGTGLDLGQLSGWTTPLRRWVQQAGLDPARIRDTDVGRATHLSILGSLTHAITNDNRISDTLPPMTNANTILGMLVHDQAIPDLELPWYQGATLRAARKVGLNKTSIALIAKTENITQAEAAQRFEYKMALGLSLRDLPQQKVLDALTTPRTITTKGGASWDWAGMKEGPAQLVYKALMDGYRQPTYMMGAQALENTARAGVGFGNKIVNNHPDNTLLQRVNNWPNKVVQTRNALRFTMSPLFDARRFVKQGYKMGLEGVPFVVNPLKKLMNDGQENEANALLQKVAGKPNALDDQQIDTDRYLQSHSLFGLYNPTWHAAYFVHNLQQQGKSLPEIKDAYYRAFRYGAQGGRSALERTANTIFFPFSFEKTLLRNTSGYLLDHPAQAMLLDAAVDEWRKADKNAAVGKWVNDHLPILKDLNKLNGFAHGISPGQLGGINAPLIGGVAGVVAHEANAAYNSHDTSAALLNMFLPQHWGVKLTTANLEKYLPVFNEFAGVWKDATQSAQVTYNAGVDTLHNVTGLGGKNFVPRPALTTSGQIGAGIQKKASLVTQLQSVLDYNNAQSSDADKITWPTDPRLPSDIWGNPVNKTTIGQYVNFLYPGYSPTAATAEALKKAAAAKSFIGTISETDPAKAAQMRAFATAANTVISRINADQYDQATITQVDSEFRIAAINMASKDGDWLKFYNQFYSHQLGPIIDYTGKGV